MDAARVTGARSHDIPKNVALMVNATPVGQHGEAQEDLAATLVPGVEAVARIDVTYGSEETPFLLAVPKDRRGTGRRMLELQAILQWSAWRLDGAPKHADTRLAELRVRGEVHTSAGRLKRGLDEFELVADELCAAFEREFVFERRRIVLLGMRGTGKTAVGEALVTATGRPLRDTDAMVEARSGRKVYDIFREDGEAAFRALEAAAVKEALEVPGAVVVLGGGAVLHLPSKPPNAWMARLRARPETLGRRLRDSGRPSLLGRPPENEVADLLRAREPIYEALTDFAVDTDDSTPEEAAGEILRRIRDRSAK
jgi:shikimate kinase